MLDEICQVIEQERELELLRVSFVRGGCAVCVTLLTVKYDNHIQSCLQVMICGSVMICVTPLQ